MISALAWNSHRCINKSCTVASELAAACETLASKNAERCMQLFEYPSVRSWSKEIDGTRTGADKELKSRRRGGRGHRAAARFNPVNPCRTGLPGVA